MERVPFSMLATELFIEGWNGKGIQISAGGAVEQVFKKIYQWEHQ